jgi:hypothetical protein
MAAEKDAIYVAQPVSEVPLAVRVPEQQHCARCNAEVWVEQAASALRGSTRLKWRYGDDCG